MVQDEGSLPLPVPLDAEKDAVVKLATLATRRYRVAPPSRRSERRSF
jgi:hypothetical protein